VCLTADKKTKASPSVKIDLRRYGQTEAVPTMLVTLKVSIGELWGSQDVK